MDEAWTIERFSPAANAVIEVERKYGKPLHGDLYGMSCEDWIVALMSEMYAAVEAIATGKPVEDVAANLNLVAAVAVMMRETLLKSTWEVTGWRDS